MLCAGEVVSDAGIVESITLKNFMCHSLLGPFTFGSNVNFVVGNNGSECNSLASEVFQKSGSTQIFLTEIKRNPHFSFQKPGLLEVCACY